MQQLDPGGGVLGYKRDGGAGPNILHPKKMHGPYIVHPKKYKTASDESYCVRKDTDDQADYKLV